MLLKLEKGFDKFADIIGYFTAFVMVLMILNVTFDVIMRYFFNSVFYSVITVFVAGLITAMAAYAISRMIWKLKGFVFGFFSIGIMIPAQAALLPLFQVLDKLGLKGGYMGLLIPYIAGAIPMSVMILSGFFKGIPKEMEEAAYLDGCGIFRCFFCFIILSFYC